MSRLANRIEKWFNETRGDGKPFDYRFTGKDSRGFLHNFMFLISVVEPYAKNAFRQKLVFHALSYICLILRECVSLFSRINITDNEIAKLKHSCKTFVTLNNLFFRPHPTAWTLGYVVPVHTQEMKTKYGMGLGLNFMEGEKPSTSPFLGILAKLIVTAGGNRYFCTSMCPSSGSVKRL